MGRYTYKYLRDTEGFSEAIKEWEEKTGREFEGDANYDGDYHEVSAYLIEKLNKQKNGINSKFEGKTAIDFFAMKNGGKTPMEMEEDGETVSPTWAAALMERYANYLLTNNKEE